MQIIQVKDGLIISEYPVKDGDYYLIRTEKSQRKETSKAPKHNTTGYRGVVFDKAKNKYRATIHANGKQVTIGRYNTAEEAHSAYIDYAKKYFGDRFIE